MSLRYLEDELLSTSSSGFAELLRPSALGDAFSHQTLRKSGTCCANVHLLVASFQEGWDWVLHHVIADSSTTASFVGFEISASEDDNSPAGNLEQALQGMVQLLLAECEFASLVEKHQAALTLFFPELTRDWLPCIGAAFPDGSRRLPDLEDTSFLDFGLDGIAAFFRDALVLAGAKAGRPAVLAVTNAQWLDRITSLLLSRICRSAAGLPFSVYVHVDSGAVDSALLKLIVSLARLGWATITASSPGLWQGQGSPILHRDLRIVKACGEAINGVASNSAECYVPQILESIAEEKRAQFTIAAFANNHVKLKELFRAAEIYSGGTAGDRYQISGCEPGTSFLIHPVWKRVLRQYLREDAERAWHAIVEQQKEACRSGSLWSRSVLHLAVQKQLWSQVPVKACDLGFRLYESMGDKKAAIAAYAAAVKFMSADSELRGRLAWLLGLTDQPEAALSQYKTAIGLPGAGLPRVLLLCRYAVLLAKTAPNDYGTASSLVDEAAALACNITDPSESLEATVRVVNAGSFLLFRAGKYQDALDALQGADRVLDGAPAREFLPLRFSVRRNIAKVLQRKGEDSAMVIRAYERILDICDSAEDPEEVRHRAMALFSIGTVEAQLGNSIAADERFRAILALPHPATRMSSAALARYVIDLYRPLAHFDLARRWVVILVQHYLQQNRIYDALMTMHLQEIRALREGRDSEAAGYHQEFESIAQRYGVSVRSLYDSCNWERGNSQIAFPPSFQAIRENSRVGEKHLTRAGSAIHP